VKPDGCARAQVIRQEPSGGTGISMRTILLLLAASLLGAAFVPLAGASNVAQVACTSATSSTCPGLVCVLPSSGDSVCVVSAIGVCIENHPPCAWDELLCVYDATTKVCVPDIS
jgi:hypothetical protein